MQIAGGRHQIGIALRARIGQVGHRGHAALKRKAWTRRPCVALLPFGAQQILQRHQIDPWPRAALHPPLEVGEALLQLHGRPALTLRPHLPLVEAGDDIAHALVDLPVGAENPSTGQQRRVVDQRQRHFDQGGATKLTP